MHRSPQGIVIALTAVVALIGLVILTGWFAGMPALTSWGEFSPLSTPAGAALFVAWGSAMLLHVLMPDDRFGAYLAALVGVFAAAFGVYALAGFVIGWPIHAAYFFEALPAEGAQSTLAPLVSTSWVLTGLATTAAIRWPASRFRLAANALAGLLILSNTVVLLGYLYGTPLLYGSGDRAVPLPSAMGFVITSVAIMLMLGPDYYPQKFLVGHAARARLLRVFLPTISVVIALDGLLAHYAPRQSGLNLSTAVSVLVFVGASVFIVYLATRVTGDSIDRAESELQAAERKVAATSAMFESLFNSIPDSVVVVDATGHIVRVNRAAENTFGYQREELVGMPIEQLIPERYRTRHYGHRAGYAERPRVRSMGANLNLFARRKDGSEFPVDIMLGPLNTALGPLVLSVVHDVSEQKRAQAEIESLALVLERQVGELEGVNKELESFSYSVSHDLRAPLRAVDGFSRILAEDYDAKLDDEGRRLIGVIQENTRRMGQLIDDLLAFSRLGRQGIATAPIDMRELVQGVVTELTQHVDAGRIDVRIGDLAPVEGDRSMLRQVFVNLIANALKFSSTRPKSVVEIGHEAREREHVYYVRDNGVGFDMQYANKLFGVFQRLHRQQDFEGTGVGLAIVQRVVHRHGGKVWAESKPDAGAVFSFSLPASTKETV